MNDELLTNTTPQQETAILAGVDTGAYNAEQSIQELWALAESAEITPLASMLQKREKPDNAAFLGEGKLEELAALVQAQEADMVIFDDELTGTQLKNCEEALGCQVLDRTLLILDIFARRAKTSESKMQVELARLQYLLPRLSGMGHALSRQGGGGAGGTGARRGAGESKLEMNRRTIRERISFLNEKLAEAQVQKQATRRRREKSEVPVIALVGYTNVGKSSLLNALCDSEVEERDMLFATLSPTARSYKLESGQEVIFVDTVGFVSRLPHQLVKAFRSTLEEAKYADVLLVVCAADDAAADVQLAVTGEVLSDLGCEGEQIIVYNKCDVAPREVGQGAMRVSAKTREGLPQLLQAVEDKLSARIALITVLLPYSESALAANLRQVGQVHEEEFLPQGVRIKATVPVRHLYRYEQFYVNP
ncbi:GTPase HflX [Ruminococcaceae bacterium OttesenSCG-928-N02]|nr:GTPase HflX [Ruminococcaceae bacterium OttesenSCG-928-N02]